MDFLNGSLSEFVRVSFSKLINHDRSWPLKAFGMRMLGPEISRLSLTFCAFI